jgi:hypothetical protein
MEGYCVKCRTKRQMENVEQVEMNNKNKTKAAKGKCSVCGTGMFKMLPKSTPAS